jgi:uncharacterized RDD family membrane protein YckC
MASSVSVGASTEELQAFRKEAVVEVEREQEVLKRLEKQASGRTLAYIISIVLVIISLVLILYRPFGFYIWLLIAFIVVCFAWLLFFLPTSRGKKKLGRKHRKASKGEIGRSVRLIIKRRKRLLTEVWVNAFFYGNALSAFSVTVIFGVSIVLALYSGFVVNDLSQDKMWIIILQCSALIAFHLGLYYYRPFAKGFFSIPVAFKGRVSKARSRNTLAVAGALMFIIIVLAIFSFLIVLGMLLPGTTLSKIREFLTENGGANTITIIIVAAIEYVVFRHFQSVTSTRMATQVVSNHIETLNAMVLKPLDEMVANSTAGKEVSADSLQAIEADFYKVAVYRIDWHDYFGLVPIYFINPDMKYLMNEDVLKILEKAGGTG